jgi:alkyl hydroperoxide reductase subunit D
MTQWIDDLKLRIPDYAKDIRLNLDGVVLRSTLGEMALPIALAAAFATGNKALIEAISADPALPEVERNAALSAASLMAMNNTWYPFVEMADSKELAGLPAQLRMNVYASNGGTSKKSFEAYALAASIVGKCHFCVKSHFDLLAKEGMSTEQLRDVGRIAAVIAAASRF